MRKMLVTWIACVGFFWSFTSVAHAEEAASPGGSEANASRQGENPKNHRRQQLGKSEKDGPGPADHAKVRNAPKDVVRPGPHEKVPPAKARKAIRENGGKKKGLREKAGSAKLLRKLDRNGDGKLDGAERTEARKGPKAKAGPAKTVGKVSRRSIEKAETIRARLLKRFDKNGDGKLDAVERAAARKALKQGTR